MTITTRIIILLLISEICYSTEYNEIMYSPNPSFNLKHLMSGFHLIHLEINFQHESYFDIFRSEPIVNIYLVPSKDFHKFTDMTKKVLNKKSLSLDVFNTIFGDHDSITEFINALMGHIDDKGFDTEWLEEYLVRPSEVDYTFQIFMFKITEPSVMIYHFTTYDVEMIIHGQIY